MSQISSLIRRRNPPRSARTGTDEQGSAQETTLDGAQLHAPVVLTALEVGFAVECDQRVLMIVPMVDPSLGDEAKLLGAINLGDVNEAGSTQQLDRSMQGSHCHGS